MPDPWIKLETDNRRPGWYFLERGQAGVGEPVDCRVDGEAAVRWVGHARLLVLLKGPRSAVEVRAVNAGDRVLPPRLRPASRPGALLHLFMQPGNTVRRVFGFARDWLEYGYRDAASALFEAYCARLSESPSGHARDCWRLRHGVLAPRSTRLWLVAANQLEPVPGGWRSTGGDPYFTIHRGDGRAGFDAGWYRISGNLEVATGEYLSPSLYVRHVSREQPYPTQLQLAQPAPGGRWSAVVRFDQAVEDLRFDPAVRPARFSMDGIGLRRMSRAEWMLRLLLDLRTGEGRPDWTAIIETLRLMLQGWRAEGPAAAGKVLARRHGELAAARTESYEAWVRRFDTLDEAMLRRFAVEGRTLAARGPLFSILLPVYETPEPWLRRCLDSVLAQAYPKWELCIADDASPSRHVTAILAEYQRRDPRIRVVRRPANGHISAASNTALAMAQGSYLALLDHDDELRPHALLEMARVLDQDPSVALVYSDEDKLDEHGRRFQPYFKPDWNEDLLLSQNYLCHFTVLQTELARSVGGFRAGFEGSQDHDLFLRCSACLEPSRIHHVPLILYHWRAIPGSTALERGAKDYASEAGVLAVADRVAAIDGGARVEALPHGHYRVRWSLPTPAPRASIIVPTRDRAELLRCCVESVLGRTAYPDFELLVVDNGSTDSEAVEYLASLQGRDRVRVLRYDAPFNFSAINNWAVARCDGSLLCLLNNDIEVIDQGWLSEMAALACRKSTGAVGAMLLYPDDSIQHAGVVLGLGGVANHAYCHQPAGIPGHGGRALVAQELSAVTAACMVVRRALYEQVGGLDERLQVAFNDIDFCLRLRAAGYRNAWTPFARLYHHESATRGQEDTSEKILRFHGEVALMRERWARLLEDDPAYNPNLSLDIHDTAAELAFPPREQRCRIAQ